MRINPNTNFTGSIQITPQSGAVDTFGETRTERLVPREILDLTGLSNTLAQYVGIKEAEARGITAKEMEAIGRRVEAGEDLADIQKEYAETSFSNARVRAQLSKSFNEAGLAPTANPLYIQSYRRGRADIRATAIRKALLDAKQIEDVALAADKKSGKAAFEAMLVVVRNKLEAAEPYKDLEGIGAAAMNEQILGITRDVLDAAERRHIERTREGVRDGIGAQVLMSAEKFTGTDDEEVQEAALSKAVFQMTEARVNGELKATEFFTDAVLAVSSELGQRDPVGAAKFLDAVLDAKEGDAEVYGKDVESRARIAVLAGQLRRRAAEESQYKDLERREDDRIVRRELSTKYMREIVEAQRSGPEAVKELFNRISAEAVNAYIDEEDREVALEWARTQANDASAMSRIVGETGNKNVDAIWESIYFDTPNDALDRLYQARSEGKINTEDFLKMHEAATARLENVWVYEKASVLNFGDNFRDEIVNSEIFLDPTKGRTDMTKVLAARARVSRQFQEELSDFLQSPEFLESPSLGVKEKLLNQFIAAKKEEYIRQVAPEGARQVMDRTLQVSAEAERTAKKLEALDIRAVTTPTDIGGFGDEAPKIIKRLNESVLSRPGAYKQPKTTGEAMKDLDFLDMGKNLDSGVKRRDFLRFIRDLEDIATDPDLKDNLGNPLSQRQRDQVIAESLAYSGAFDLDELVMSTAKPKTIEAIGGGEKREGGRVFPGVEKSLLLSPTLRLEDLDITRVPIPDVAKLGLAVTPDEDGQVQGIKVTPENRENIDKVRALLRSYKLDDSDRSVGLFIRHQYNITR